MVRFYLQQKAESFKGKLILLMKRQRKTTTPTVLITNFNINSKIWHKSRVFLLNLIRVIKFIVLFTLTYLQQCIWYMADIFSIFWYILILFVNITKTKVNLTFIKMPNYYTVRKYFDRELNSNETLAKLNDCCVDIYCSANNVVVNFWRPQDIFLLSKCRT